MVKEVFMQWMKSTDAMVGPTRGGDWDDAGVWRQLHTYWDHPEVRNA
jgi:hypothetical protein